jgi:hypothetical protein
MAANQEDRSIRRKIKDWMSNVEPPADGWSKIEDHFKKQASEPTIYRRISMFSVNPYISEQFWRQRRDRILHDAEQYRLVKLASASQGSRARPYDQVLAALGNLLVDWGARLQARQRGRIHYSGPIVRTSTSHCHNNPTF